MKKFYLILFLTALVSSLGYGQCANNGILYDDLTPAGVGLANSGYTSCAYGGEYYTVSVAAGNTYNFNTCGSTYDTQLTLFTNSGVYLGYDDDGSVCGSGASDLTWVATYTGVARIQMNEYNCVNNSVCAPLEVVLVSVGAGCGEGFIALTQGACESNSPTINVTFGTLGDCGVVGVYVSTDGFNYDFVTFGGTLFHSETLNLFGTVAYETYYIYGLMSDGSTTNESSITLGDCGFVGCQEVTFVINPDCFGEEVSWTLYNSLNQEVYSVFTGDYPAGLQGDVAYATTLCLLPGCYTFEIYDSFGDGLSVANPIDCAVDGFYFAFDSNAEILFDGSPNYTFANSYDFCLGSEPCAFTNATASYSGCVDGLNEFALTGFFTGDCTVSEIYYYNAIEGWQVADASGFGFVSGQPMYLSQLLNNTSYLFYLTLSDGTESSTYSFTTQNCQETCGFANLELLSGECVTVGATTYASANLYFDYVGTCSVTEIYYSVDGGFSFDFLDVSADGIVNGSFETYYFAPGTEYFLFYVLENGEQSNLVSYLTSTCESGETICDCAGTQLPVEALAWLGDGSLDDGTYLWNNELPVDFNCQLWGFDCDDAGVGVTLDPYTVCSGNLPPANGCVEGLCEGVYVEVAIDCYPGETAVDVINEAGETVYSFGLDFFTEEYTMVTQPMCLEPGCYTFAIYDEFGDGLAHPNCEFMGYATVVDAAGNTLVEVVGDFGFSFISNFCVGGDDTCSNLDFDINAEPCVDYANETLTPSLSLTFDYNGDCSVAAIFIAPQGGTYDALTYVDGELTSGMTEQIYNFAPNTTYNIFYELSDGSTSFVQSYTTGNCNNEVTICDCDGTQHSIGVLEWLGDGFADNGAYDWVGQPVDFNCAVWGFDCGDVAGSPSTDIYGVCSGNLPPNNGCVIENNDVFGCTDPDAINYNPLATINNGSCVYNTQFGCTDPSACNYYAEATFDNGSCEYLTCAGCTNPSASNYDASATIDDGSCNFDPILGCTDPTALNYNSLATEDDGSCVFSCDWPNVTYTTECVDGDTENFIINMQISDLGNGAPYIVTNSYNQAQYNVNFVGSIQVGPFPNDEDVVITVVSSAVPACFITSPVLSHNCTEVIDNVNEIVANGMISIYPNPAKSILNLYNSGETTVYQIRILDNTGRLVFSNQINVNSGATSSMDVSQFASGTYYVEIIGNNRIQHEKLMIQK